MKQGMTIEELAANFPEQVFEKLKDMNVSPSFNPGTSRAKDLFKSLLEGMRTLKSDVERIASADRIADVILRDAAKKAAVEFSQARRLKLVYGVASLLSLEGWKIADVVAKTLVREFATSRKAKMAIRHGANADLHLRYYVELTPSPNFGSGEAFMKNVAKLIRETFNSRIELESVNWVPEFYRFYLIVKTSREVDVIAFVHSLLIMRGVDGVNHSLLVTFDCDPPVEPQPEPAPAIDPLETHEAL